jgi:3-hydroxyacyl-CoA dehydrogenase
MMPEEGALPEQVDNVMVDFGYPIGPFATADLSGLDIGYDSRQRRAAQIPNYRKSLSPTRSSRPGAWARRSGPAGFVTRKATAPRTSIPKLPA